MGYPLYVYTVVGCMFACTEYRDKETQRENVDACGFRAERW